MLELHRHLLAAGNNGLNLGRKEFADTRAPARHAVKRFCNVLCQVRRHPAGNAVDKLRGFQAVFHGVNLTADGKDLQQVQERITVGFHKIVALSLHVCKHLLLLFFFCSKAVYGIFRDALEILRNLQRLEADVLQLRVHKEAGILCTGNHNAAAVVPDAHKNCPAAKLCLQQVEFRIFYFTDSEREEGKRLKFGIRHLQVGKCQRLRVCVRYAGKVLGSVDFARMDVFHCRNELFGGSAVFLRGERQLLRVILQVRDVKLRTHRLQPPVHVRIRICRCVAVLVVSFLDNIVLELELAELAKVRKDGMDILLVDHQLNQAHCSSFRHCVPPLLRQSASPAMREHEGANFQKPYESYQVHSVSIYTSRPAGTR